MYNHSRAESFDSLLALTEELLKTLRYLENTGIIHDAEKIERWNREFFYFSAMKCERFEAVKNGHG